MAIEKKTIIDQIEIDRAGRVNVRFGLLLVEDGAEISCKWHRTQIEPGVDVDALFGIINADITTRPELKAAPIDSERVSLVKAVCDLVYKSDPNAYEEGTWTPQLSAPDEPPGVVEASK